MNNPGIDLMIRLKNGYMANRQTIESPHSGFREKIIQKLKELRYVEEYSIEGDTIKKIIITLRYPDNEAALTDVKIYSTPGRRWYSASKDLTPTSTGVGVTLLSTSQGILTNKEAKEKKVGGELLFSVW